METLETTSLEITNSQTYLGLNSSITQTAYYRGIDGTVKPVLFSTESQVPSFGWFGIGISGHFEVKNCIFQSKMSFLRYFWSKMIDFKAILKYKIGHFQKKNWANPKSGQKPGN